MVTEKIAEMDARYPLLTACKANGKIDRKALEEL